MDEHTIDLLSRIARALESIAESLADSRSPDTVFYSEDKWENRDLNELYAEFEDEQSDDESDEEPAGNEDWSYDAEFEESSYDTEREYFNTMTDGMLGDYDDFADSGGSSDWISDWSGR